MLTKTVADRWHHSSGMILANNATITGYVAGQAMFTPVRFYAAGSVEGMGVYKTTSSNRADKYQLGLFTSDNGLPALLVEDFGEVSMSTGGVEGIISGSGVGDVEPGTYWLGIQLNALGGAGTQPSVIRQGGGAGVGPEGIKPHGLPGTQSGFGSISAICGIANLGTGAFDADISGETFTNGSTMSTLPWFTFEVAPEEEGGGPGWGWHNGQAYWSVIE